MGTIRVRKNECTGPAGLAKMNGALTGGLRHRQIMYRPCGPRDRRTRFREPRQGFYPKAQGRHASRRTLGNREPPLITNPLVLPAKVGHEYKPRAYLHSPAACLLALCNSFAGIKGR